MLGLLALAIIPSIVLLVIVYKADKIEKEPKRLIFKTILFGAISVVPTVLVELGVEYGLNLVIPQGSVMYTYFETFFGVALVEELFKLWATKLAIWKRPEFNYRFDGIVYCVAGALGFATVENIMYVIDGGFSTGIVRALISVPGHAIFGIMMGCFFGLAKEAHKRGNVTSYRSLLIVSVILPTIAHGLFDFALELGNILSIMFFVVFVIAMDVFAILILVKQSKEDRPI